MLPPLAARSQKAQLDLLRTTSPAALRAYPVYEKTVSLQVLWLTQSVTMIKTLNVFESALLLNVTAVTPGRFGFIVMVVE